MTPFVRFWEVGGRGGVPDEYLTFRTLVQRGHEVHVAAPAGADYALPGEGPGRLVLHPMRYPARRLRGRIIGQLGRLRDLALARRAFGGGGFALARALRPDLILAHTFHTAPWAAAVGERLGIPVVAKFFGVTLLDTGWEPRLLHFLRHFEHYLAFRRPFARVIVLDDGTGGDEAARRLGVPPDRLLFWPNGVNVEWADMPLSPGGGDRAVRARLGLEADAVYTLTLANLRPLKRIERVLGAIEALGRDGGSAVRALIGGDGSMRPQLEALAARLDLGDRVRFLGPIDHDHVPELMSAANIYVAPHDFTNAGLPTCEAMLCRLPVVAMDAGKTRRLVADGETGLVVPHGDVGALARAIRRLAEDPALRWRMGERGHAAARKRFVSWERRVGMEVELLEAVSAGRG
jgi:glycosyltransferase involved in cell wall biosynthesis